MISEPMRLQKYLSQAGICSRRKAEEYILQWQVFVNWQPAELGMSINPESDVIELWDTALELQKKYVYYVFYKPRGIETTCAQKWGSSIIDIISVPERVFPAGRLDKDSTWLILLTNDGRITNYLTHPRYWHEKEYVVEVFWSISDAALEKIASWVPVLWKLTLPCPVKRIASWKFSIVLKEWRNRQIRRMVEYVWWKVKKLKRIRIENIELWSLWSGEIRHMTSCEKKQLFYRMWIEDTSGYVDTSKFSHLHE